MKASISLPTPPFASARTGLEGTGSFLVLEMVNEQLAAGSGQSHYELVVALETFSGIFGHSAVQCVTGR